MHSKASQRRVVSIEERPELAKSRPEPSDVVGLVPVEAPPGKQRADKRCREAAETLSNVQTEFLRGLTEEITESAEDFLEGDFLLNEFVDRYGPRLAHLNGVLQVLSQLSTVPSPTGTYE